MREIDAADNRRFHARWRICCLQEERAYIGGSDIGWPVSLPCPTEFGQPGGYRLHPIVRLTEEPAEVRHINPSARPVFDFKERQMSVSSAQPIREVDRRD